MSDADLQVFEDARPRLLGLAYRIPGVLRVLRRDVTDLAVIDVLTGARYELSARRLFHLQYLGIVHPGSISDAQEIETPPRAQ